MMRGVKEKLTIIASKTNLSYRYEHEFTESKLTEEEIMRKKALAEERDSYDYTEEGNYC